MSIISRLFDLVGSFDPPVSPHGAGIARDHDALMLLGSLAKADGVLGARERTALAAVASTRIGMNAAALAFLDDPDHEGLEDVAARMRRTWSEAERTDLMNKAATVAEADGAIGEIEVAMLERLARLLDVDPPRARYSSGEGNAADA